MMMMMMMMMVMMMMMIVFQLLMDTMLLLKMIVDENDRKGDNGVYRGWGCHDDDNDDCYEDSCVMDDE